LPFAVEIPNEETERALEDSRSGRDLERFESADALIESWKYMKEVIQTSQFKKDIKRLKKRGENLEQLGEVS
jgi:hypothetical protein